MLKQHPYKPVLHVATTRNVDAPFALQSPTVGLVPRLAMAGKTRKLDFINKQDKPVPAATTSTASDDKYTLVGHHLPGGWHIWGNSRGAVKLLDGMLLLIIIFATCADNGNKTGSYIGKLLMSGWWGNVRKANYTYVNVM